MTPFEKKIPELDGSFFQVIDEKPPCPYEIYSVIKPKILCVVNITEFHKPFKPCPQVISLEKLLETCNNPIVTKWRIIRNYSSKENTIGICQGRDSCEITTLYLVKTLFIRHFISDSMLY